MAKNILVVEDDAALRRLFLRLLGDRGHSLTLAASMEEGLLRLADGGYDLLITDFDLTDGSGETLLKAAGRIRKILISGSLCEAEIVGLAQRYRLDGFFLKPFPLNELLESIERGLA